MEDRIDTLHSDTLRFRTMFVMVLVFLFMVLSFGFAIAGGDEISQLEDELVSSGYDWLVDYKLNLNSIDNYKLLYNNWGLSW